jgi:hypothetical protein
MSIEERATSPTEGLAFFINEDPFTIGDANRPMVIQKFRVAGQGIREQAIVSIQKNDFRSTGKRKGSETGLLLTTIILPD